MTPRPWALQRSRIATRPRSALVPRAAWRNDRIRFWCLVGFTDRRGPSIRGGERQMARAGVSPGGHDHCRQPPRGAFSTTWSSAEEAGLDEPGRSRRPPSLLPSPPCRGRGGRRVTRRSTWCYVVTISCRIRASPGHAAETDTDEQRTFHCGNGRRISGKPAVVPATRARRCVGTLANRSPGAASPCSRTVDDHCRRPCESDHQTALCRGRGIVRSRADGAADSRSRPARARSSGSAVRPRRRPTSARTTIRCASSVRAWSISSSGAPSAISRASDVMTSLSEVTASAYSRAAIHNRAAACCQSAMARAIGAGEAMRCNVGVLTGAPWVPAG